MTPKFKALTPAGEWVEGWFGLSDKKRPVIWTNDFSTGNPVEVLPETVCMATGRPDSTGKMMYNGDFVQVEEWFALTKGCSGIYRIEYNTVDCGFVLVDDNKSGENMAICFNEMDTYTLTGKNIHDKPSAE